MDSYNNIIIMQLKTRLSSNQYSHNSHAGVALRVFSLVCRKWDAVRTSCLSDCACVYIVHTVQVRVFAQVTVGPLSDTCQ